HRKPQKEVLAEIKARLRQKKATQPLALAAAGMIWKTPGADQAGRLFEKAGLRGKRIGAAEISAKHANFVVNRGGAAARDILAVGTILVVGSVASHWIRHTPLLAVAAVEIAGLHRLPEGLVRTAAAVPPGANLVAFDPAAVAARVEALPGVRRARVIRQLPDRVTVLVEERAPYALLNVGGGPGAGPGRPEGLVWIDVEGHLGGAEPRPG